MLALLQVGVGFLNVILLAPVWLQMVHLLIADAIWIGFVMVGAHGLRACSPTPIADGRTLNPSGGSRLASAADSVVR